MVYKFNADKQVSKNMKKQASGKSKTEDVFAHALWKAITFRGRP